MATELKDYIRCYDGVISDQFCENVIQTFDLDVENQERIDRDKRPSFTELNISQQYQKQNPKWMDVQVNIQKTFIEYVSLYMKDLDLGPDFPARYAFEEYRMKRYAPKVDEFMDHVDVGDYQSARRFLVCFLYLNDVSNGGETDFPKLGYSIQPKRARLLIFPPLWMYRHAGRSVVNGHKYIVGSYLHYL
jgi:hypothetical protein